MNPQDLTLSIRWFTAAIADVRAAQTLSFALFFSIFSQSFGLTLKIVLFHRYAPVKPPFLPVGGVFQYTKQTLILKR